MHVYYSRGPTSQLVKVECEENDDGVTLIIFHFRKFQHLEKKRQLRIYLSTSAFGGSVVFFWQHNNIALTDANLFSFVMRIFNALELLDDEDKPLLDKFIASVIKTRASKSIMLIDPHKLDVMENENKRLSRVDLNSLSTQCRKSKIREIYWSGPNLDSPDVVIFQLRHIKSNIKRQRLLIYLSALKVNDAALVYHWQKNCLILSDYRHFKVVLRLLTMLHLSSKALSEQLLEVIGLEPRVSAESGYLNLPAIQRMSKVLLKNYIDDIFDNVKFAEGMTNVTTAMLLVMQSTKHFTAAFQGDSLPLLWKNKHSDALAGINLILNGYLGEPLSTDKGYRREVKDELRRYALECMLEAMHKKFVAVKISALFFALYELVFAMNKLIESSPVYSVPSRLPQSSSRFFAQSNNGRSVGMMDTFDYNDLDKIFYALKLIDDDGQYHMQKLNHLQQQARCVEIDRYIEKIEYAAKQNTADADKLQKATSSRVRSRSQ